MLLIHMNVQEKLQREMNAKLQRREEKIQQLHLLAGEVTSVTDLDITPLEAVRPEPPPPPSQQQQQRPRERIPSGADISRGIVAVDSEHFRTPSSEEYRMPPPLQPPPPGRQLPQYPQYNPSQPLPPLPSKNTVGFAAKIPLSNVRSSAGRPISGSGNVQKLVRNFDGAGAPSGQTSHATQVSVAPTPTRIFQPRSPQAKRSNTTLVKASMRRRSRSVDKEFCIEHRPPSGQLVPTPSGMMIIEFILYSVF